MTDAPPQAAPPAAPQSVSEKIRSANLANIIARLKAGKTLTQTEQNALDAHELGGAGAAGEPARLRKNKLAVALGVSRVTLDAYLNRTEPPAPLPDNHGEFSVEEVAGYISKIKGDESKKKGMTYWEAEKRRLQCEEIVTRLEILRGKYISKEEASRTIGPLMGELAESLRMEFELKLPALYKGRDMVACAELNRHAVDRIIARFRTGATAFASVAA